MIYDLKNQVVFITGGGRGIGKSIAFKLAQAGARVAISARSPDELKATQKMIVNETGQECLALPCDVMNYKQLEQTVNQVAEKMGAITGLVCAAGIYGSIGPFIKTDFKEWEKGLDINLKGTAMTVHLVAPKMVEKKSGRIILFSGGGQGALANFSSYVTSKGAIWRFTETVGAELASHSVFMNAIAPGAVNTQFLDDLLKAGPDKVGTEFYNKALEQQKSGGQSPDKAAQLCVYLMSEYSKGLYGKTLSAVWDKYEEWEDLNALSKSEIYTMRRLT